LFHDHPPITVADNARTLHVLYLYFPPNQARQTVIVLKWP